MARLFFILLSVMLIGNECFAGSMEEFERYFKILPRPQKVELIDGKGILFSDIHNICLNNTTHLPVMPAILEGLPNDNLKREGTLVLSINKSLNLPSREGYILEIKNGQVFIDAGEQAGLFYGIQTLSQLMEDSHDQSVRIPSCRITDYPAIATRAVHIDLKSHLDATNYYYKTIDRLAGVKINTIIIEFEDKLRYRKAKYVGAPNAISIEEFAGISKYASERNIEISPLVQGLGHASFILKHEEYKDLRDDSLSDYAFDPLNPKTYDLQFSLYEDAITATPFGKYLHVGGDEVGKIGRSALAKKSGMKPLQLQMYWLKKVTDFAIAHKRIPVFWDDMVFKLAGLYQTLDDSTMSEQTIRDLWSKNRSVLDENIALFPRNCIYARWNYEAPMVLGNRLAIDWYKANNLNVIPATAAQQGYLMLQRNHSNFKYIQQFCRLASEKNIDKILCTIWDDSSPHFEVVMRGICSFAMCSWNGSAFTEETVFTTFRHRFYAPELQSDKYEFQNLLEDEINFWETALLADGDRENYRTDFRYIDVPDLKSGEWSSKYKEKIAGAEKSVAVYKEIKSRISNCLLLTRRNRYAIEVMNQMNEVQVYSAQLILLLHGFDTSASKTGKRNALARIRAQVGHFDELHNSYDSVYSKTRMLKNPEGYINDSNARRHWAELTNNTDWNFYLELEMNKRVLKWVDNTIL